MHYLGLGPLETTSLTSQGSGRLCIVVHTTLSKLHPLFYTEYVVNLVHNWQVD